MHGGLLSDWKNFLKNCGRLPVRRHVEILKGTIKWPKNIFKCLTCMY